MRRNARAFGECVVLDPDVFMDGLLAGQHMRIKRDSAADEFVLIRTAFPSFLNIVREIVYRQVAFI